MQIVTDRGADLVPEQLDGLNVHFAPLRITLDEKTYVSGVDLQPDAFYNLLTTTESFPTTSTPAPGDFTQLYSTLAKTDPDILSIHISSGLSSTLSSAKIAAAMVPEARVTFFDSKTLSCPLGWQVEAAARAAKAGWNGEQIIEMLQKIRQHSEGIFTLTSLKYLIHGGRISHLKGLVGSLLNVKPVISPDKEEGKYVTFGQEMTLSRALNRIVDRIIELYGKGSALRMQLLHGQNLEAVELLRQRLLQTFECTWLPVAHVAPVLGAHTGPSLVGLAVGPVHVFPFTS